MSNERFDIVQFKKGKNDKTYAVRLGWATKRDDGGMWLNLDALPFGEGSVAATPQRERAETGALTKEVNAMKRELREDDGIPF